MVNPQVNSAIKKIDKSIADLNSNLEVVGKYTYDKLSNVMDEIEAKKLEAANLDSNFKEKLREKEVSLALDVRANEESTMRTLAQKFGFKLVPNQELSELQQGVAKAKAESEANAKKAVAMATRTLNFEHEKNSHDCTVEIASLRGQLSQVQAQNDFLSKQLDLKTTELREAGMNIVKVAEAAKATAVSVGK